MDPKEGQVGGQPGDAGTKANQGGQPTQTPDQPASQLPPDTQEIELEGGVKVTFGELRKGYIKDADYRQKTEAVARDRETVERDKAELERQKTEAAYARSGQNVPGAEGYNEGEEPTQDEINEARLGRIEAFQAQSYLTGKVESFSKEFPDADKESVFNSCWNNPNTNIRDEMEKSQNKVLGIRGSVTHEQLFADPEKKKEYDQTIIDKYNANKRQSGAAGGGFASPSGSGAAPGEPVEVAKDDNEARDRLLQDLNEQD